MLLSWGNRDGATHGAALFCDRQRTEEVPCAGLCGSACQCVKFDTMSRIKQVEIMFGSGTTKLLNPHYTVISCHFYLLTGGTCDLDIPKGDLTTFKS